MADLLDAVEDKNGPRAADTVLAIIRKMMNWVVVVSGGGGAGALHPAKFLPCRTLIHL